MLIILSFILLFLLIAGMYMAEALHDKIIELVQRPEDVKLIEAWHKADALFHVLLNLIISWVSFVFVPVIIFAKKPLWLEGIIFGIMLLGFRQIFMVIPLNIMRNRKPLYIGSTAKFDKVVKKYGVLVFVLALLLIIGGMWYFYLLAKTNLNL